MAEAEMTISALDSFEQELIEAHCVWGRFDDAHVSWRKANNWGGPIVSAMPWKGFVTTTPHGHSDAESLQGYAKELVKKYPELHITVHDGVSSISIYGAGVLSMAKHLKLNFD